MNNPNTENATNLRAQLREKQQLNEMVDTLENAAKARNSSAHNNRVARAFARHAERLVGMPHMPSDMQDEAVSRHADYAIRSGHFDDEAKRHYEKADEIALQIGEHVVQNSVSPVAEAPVEVPADEHVVIDLR